jgi:uncharacterized protein (TIGR03083 family)
VTAETCLDATVRIDVLDALRAVNAALLELLEGLSDADWAQPTVHADRDVKDLAAHLLHGSLRRVTSLRDGYRRPAPPLEELAELVAFIQQDNRAFMAGMRRISPRILIELTATYDRELVRLFERLDPDAPGLGVAWAGERVSRNWFDVAREHTEKWHHQQQLRDAVGSPPLYDRALFAPVLETFARGLPHAFRGHPPAAGARITVATTGALSLCWTLRGDGSSWTLWRGRDPEAPTTITIPAEVAWRLWTKSCGPDEARSHIQLRGDAAALDPLLRFVAIMA